MPDKDRRIQIEHPTTGLRYEVTLDDYRNNRLYLSPKSGQMITYASAGFRIMANADGTEYVPEPQPKEAEEEEAPTRASRDKPAPATAEKEKGNAKP